MLSYRHAFHAGNHADVLKHLVQVLSLQYLVQKAGKPLCYIDTHAGAGRYDLSNAFSGKNREHEAGIARLWARDDLPAPLQGYIDVVRRSNMTGELRYYPGSPAIAASILDANHRLQLYELHPDDAARLERWTAHDGRIHMQQEDGLAALRAILPPMEKRALVMMDPPYEIKTDYSTVVAALRSALKKFATGVYVLWYPLLLREEVGTLVKKLEALAVKSLLVELPVEAAGRGMYGSGIFVVNPPWVLEQQLRDCLPYLHAALANPGAQPWRIHSSGS